jgi:hypothetical protein
MYQPYFLRLFPGRVKMDPKIQQKTKTLLRIVSKDVSPRKKRKKYDLPE